MSVDNHLSLSGSSAAKIRLFLSLLSNFVNKLPFSSAGYIFSLSASSPFWFSKCLSHVLSVPPCRCWSQPHSLLMGRALLAMCDRDAVTSWPGHSAFRFLFGLLGEHVIPACAPLALGLLHRVKSQTSTQPIIARALLETNGAWEDVF